MVANQSHLKKKYGPINMQYWPEVISLFATGYFASSTRSMALISEWSRWEHYYPHKCGMV